MTAGPTLPDDVAETLVDPRAYADGRIHDAYRWLRQNEPLGVARPKGYDPFWVATRHADILEVSRQNELFHSGDLQTTLTNQATDALVRQKTGGSPHLVRSLVQMDAPDHPKYRLLSQAWFMPANVRTLETRIREIARASVERMAQLGGRCDFVKDVALRYPLHVIMEILGVPEEDEARMQMLTQELFGPQDPDTARAAEDSQEQTADALGAVLDDFYAYFERISAERRASPKGDLATLIANATIDGVPISGLEQLSYYVIVATAGHDTTSSSTAGAIWQLCEDQEQFARVKADPSLIPGLVDEAIRWVTPVKHFMRSATADTELNGRHIAKGDWLMLCYASGNRDEAVFEDPYRFRIDRKPNRHLAFGYGGHVCLGQHLAKLEMRIFFEELFARLERIELAGEPAQTQAVFVNGPKSLPLRFEMA
ncbi:cytochrome P450 [Phenylobacterium sp.]|jgi:hypothetical protein|uniref:cytochrome P450 n=1 Tax=Phenylobacterium sp. TaxID=1871053 RepID=UPI002F41BAF2